MVDMKENKQRFAVPACFFDGETGVDSVKDTMDQSYLHASVFNHLWIVVMLLYSLATVRCVAMVAAMTQESTGTCLLPPPEIHEFM